MKRMEQYAQLLEIVRPLHIDELGEPKKLLCADIWNSTTLSKRGMLVRILAIIASDVITLHEYADSKAAPFVAVEIAYPNASPRRDNALIFENLYTYLKPAVHIQIEKRYRLNLTHVFSKLSNMARYAKLFSGMPRLTAYYLAAQLLVAQELKQKSGFVDGKKLMLIFQEDDLISSTIIQYAQSKGVCVISPQHGMPMNRHEDMDQLHFDGFLADYKLLWNEATKEQFLSAGIDESHLVVVGNTKKLDDNDEIEPIAYSDRLGVILDCPDYEYALDSNLRMLEYAKGLAESFGLKLVVKVHPRDDKTAYLKIVSEEDILGISSTIEEYEKMVCISIGHTTGAIFDLIYDGKIVFQYVDNARFPVETLDTCKFSSTIELNHIFKIWKKNWYNLYNDYLKKVVPRYHVKNARERHDAFFSKLFEEIN